MIDIHTHIIPDLDDGPPNMETSVQMGRIAAEDGISAIISTSHGDDTEAIGIEIVRARLDEVRSAWQAAGLQIRLELGVEIFLRPDTVSGLKAGSLWTLAASRYVLVELPYQPWPLYADDALFNLQLAGYLPVLAHPERYTAIQSDPNRMYTLAERGILSQVTAAALTGDRGTRERQCAETLLRHNLAQFLSSDAHGLTTHKRLPRLRGALKVAEAVLEPEAAQRLVLDNPAAVLSDTQIIPEPERVAPRKWSLGNIFGR